MNVCLCLCVCVGGGGVWLNHLCICDQVILDGCGMCGWLRFMWHTNINDGGIREQLHMLIVVLRACYITKRIVLYIVDHIALLVHHRHALLKSIA